MERITGTASYPFHKYFSLNPENNDYFFSSSLNRRLFQNLTLLMVLNFQISSQNVFVATRLFLCQCCLPVWEALLFLSCSIPSCPHPTCCTDSRQPPFWQDSLSSCFLVAFPWLPSPQQHMAHLLQFEFLSDLCCASYSRVKLASAL